MLARKFRTHRLKNSYSPFTRTNKTSLIAVFVVGFCSASPSVIAGEFWANPLGGGAEEVFVRQVSPAGFQARSNSDWVEPTRDSSGNLIYEVKADANASVAFMATGLNPIAVPSNEISTRSTLRNESDYLASPSKIVAEPGSSELLVPEGNWTVMIPANNAEAFAPSTRAHKGLKTSTEPDLLSLRVNIDESPYSLSVKTDELTTARGMQVTVNARVTDNTGEDLTEEAISGQSYQLANAKVTATIATANGKTEVRKLQDNGKRRSGDVARNDNVFSIKHKFVSDGMHTISIVAEGEIGGKTFRRESLVYVLVGPNRMKSRPDAIQATLGSVLDTPLEQGRFGLPTIVKVNKGAMPEIVNTYAEIWAKDASGNDAVVGWVGGLVQPIDQGGSRYAIPLTLHSGWLELDDFYAPYTLRELMLQDPDTGEQMVTNKRKIKIKDLYRVESEQLDGSLRSSRLANDAKTNAKPSIEMLQGAHPSTLHNGAAEGIALRMAHPSLLDNQNPRILSMHGWCQTGKNLNSYSTNIRNRSLIYPDKNSGISAAKYANAVAAWLRYTPGSIRGVVAHSQGGLAAASLLQHYPYLFADNAMSRPVNVLSMGSPYHGSSLMSNRRSVFFPLLIRALGHVVENCSIPHDLVPSLNNRWRKHIGTRARSQIESWVTTHKKRKNEPFNCGPASFIIRGHDDGVISYYDPGGFPGLQVPNRYKWCHTASLGENQWRHPDFLNRVNTHFASRFENWEPY